MHTELLIGPDGAAAWGSLGLTLALAVSTWRMARLWLSAPQASAPGAGTCLTLLILLDAYVIGLYLPNVLCEQIRVSPSNITLTTAPWYRPRVIVVSLANVEVIYEVLRSRHVLERDRFWLLQDRSFRRQRMHLSPLFVRQRQRIRQFLCGVEIPVLEHRNFTSGAGNFRIRLAKQKLPGVLVHRGSSGL